MTEDHGEQWGRVGATLALLSTVVACSSERPNFGSTTTTKDDAAIKSEDGSSSNDGGEEVLRDGSANVPSGHGTESTASSDVVTDGGNTPSQSDAADSGATTPSDGGAINEEMDAALSSDAASDAEAIEPECREDSECAWSDCLDGKCAKAVKIAGGQSGARCVLRDRGDVACWGVTQPALGSGNPSSAIVSDPTLVSGMNGDDVLTGVTDIAVGGGTFCALLTSREVVCWGIDSSGALGRGSTVDTQNAVTPGYVVGLSGTGKLGDVVKLGARASNTHCALRAGGDAVCWGANPNGTLGNGSSGNRGVPSLVLGEGGTATLQSLSDVQGAFTSCALGQSGQVYCWGSDQYYVIPEASPYPTRIVGAGGGGMLDNAIALSTSSAPCALLDGGEVVCWGDNSYGALGRGTIGPAGVDAWTSVPELVSNPEGTAPLLGIAQISGVSGHTCALTDQGTVYCWGSNSSYQLGRGTMPGNASGLPQQVLGIDGVGVLNDVVSIGSGFSFTCAIRTQGDVVCWGLIEERFEPEYEVVRSQFPALISKPEN